MEGLDVGQMEECKESWWGGVCLFGIFFDLFVQDFCIGWVKFWVRKKQQRFFRREVLSCLEEVEGLGKGQSERLEKGIEIFVNENKRLC